MIALILAIAQAVPIINAWLDMLYNARIEAMKKEDRDAIRKSLDEHDQRDVEKAIDSPTAGLPSNDPGAVIVDKPPRMS